MEVYTMHPGEIEELLDSSKTIILASLVAEGYIADDVADDWCRNHTLVVRKKTMFRTISKLWKRAAEAVGFYVLCVKFPVPHCEETPVKDVPVPLEIVRKNGGESQENA